MQAIGQLSWPPRMIVGGPGTVSASTVALLFDSSTDKFAYVGSSHIADSLNKIYFRLGTVSTGGGVTVDVRVETLTNGRPSGTLINAGANVNVVIADTDDNTWKTATLGTPATLTLGQDFAIVIVWVSGATPAWNMVGLPMLNGNAHIGHYPQALIDQTGSWVNAGNVELFAEATTAGVIALPNLLPVDGAGVLTAITNASAPNEYALKFVAPVKCRVMGLSPCIWNIAAGADFTISLWPASSSVDGDALMQASVDGDIAFTTSQDGYVTVFDTPVELAAGTTYYLGVRADTANALSVGTLPIVTTITNAIRALPIDGCTAHLATRTWTTGTAGAWTDTTTTFPLMSLIIDQLDDGTGGGRAALSIGV